MDISIYLDLQQEYLVCTLKNFKLINSVVDTPNLPPDKVLIISDDENAATKWWNYAVVGVEHKQRLSDIPYVTDSLINIDEDFVELVYCRKFNMPMIIKETEHLIIREMSLGDISKICALYEDEEDVQFLPPIKSYEEELELAKAYIKNMYGIYGYGLWILIHKKTGEIIGRAGIEHREIEGRICHELGYMIARNYQGCGLGYEAATAVLEFAREYGIEEMIAYINEKNTPSVNLAIRLGACKVKTINDGVSNFILFRF